MCLLRKITYGEFSEFVREKKITHSKGRYLQNLQKRIFKFNITFYSFGYVTLEKLLEQIAPLNWGFFLKSQHFSLVPQPRDGSGQNPTRGCFAQLNPSNFLARNIFFLTRGNFCQT